MFCSQSHYLVNYGPIQSKAARRLCYPQLRPKQQRSFIILVHETDLGEENLQLAPVHQSYIIIIIVMHHY